MNAIHKNQTERLIQHLNNGNPINFIEAYFDFGIQDLRKRLCEVREEGYRLSAHKERDIWKGHTLRSWRIDTPLRKGDYVEIVAAPVLPNGTHPLKGRMGRIADVFQHTFIIADGAGNSFGRFRHRDLRKLGTFAHGEEVRLLQGTLKVAGYHPSENVYILEGKDRRFFADPSLLEPLPRTVRTDSRGFTPLQ